MVKTMYTDSKLVFKINGTTDHHHIKPTNGLAQGCPLSPCLYLLCIQGLISLMNEDEKKEEGLRGIPIPNDWGETNSPTILITSAFADDVCVFMKNAKQLTRFRTLLNTYCEGAGAENS